MLQCKRCGQQYVGPGAGSTPRGINLRIDTLWPPEVDFWPLLSTPPLNPELYTHLCVYKALTSVLCQLYLMLSLCPICYPSVFTLLVLHLSLWLSYYFTNSTSLSLYFCTLTFYFCDCLFGGSSLPPIYIYLLSLSPFAHATCKFHKEKNR